jgi:hypothetical protein
MRVPLFLGLLALGCAAAALTPSDDPAYNESEALLAYQYAKIAVCDLSDILAFNCSACGNRTAGFFTSWAIESKEFDVQVFVGFDAPRNMIVVSFRGSKTLSNWINDMRFAHVDTPFPECTGCFLHKGFIRSYDSIAVPLFVAVGQLRSQYNTSKLMVTGHSLGGALAQLAALDLIIHDQFAVFSAALYTFGSPRIGNNNFQLYLQSKTFGWRVVNQRDLVPQVAHHCNLSNSRRRSLCPPPPPPLPPSCRLAPASSFSISIMHRGKFGSGCTLKRLPR